MESIVLNPEVDAYVSKIKTWRDETEKLRSIALDCGLTEELKWAKPCYAAQGKNIVIIQGFKAYCALLFFNGYLLKDPDGILIKTGEHTEVGRQIRFTDVQTIIEMEPLLKKYIKEAIEAEKSGLKSTVQKNTTLNLTEEFQSVLNTDSALKTAFEALTPGRQKAYSIYFSQPKQSKTRESRIEKFRQQILAGKGLND